MGNVSAVPSGRLRSAPAANNSRSNNQNNNGNQRRNARSREAGLTELLEQLNATSTEERLIQSNLLDLLHMIESERITAVRRSPRGRDPFENDTNVSPPRPDPLRIPRHLLSLSAREVTACLRDQGVEVPSSEDIEGCFCPISQCLMADPVKAADGQTYEAMAIEQWLSAHNTSPLTNLAIPTRQLLPDTAVRDRVEQLVSVLTAVPRSSTEKPPPPPPPPSHSGSDEERAEREEQRRRSAASAVAATDAADGAEEPYQFPEKKICVAHTCNNCNCPHIVRADWFRCDMCYDFDLCRDCYSTAGTEYLERHKAQHTFREMGQVPVRDHTFPSIHECDVCRKPRLRSDDWFFCGECPDFDLCRSCYEAAGPRVGSHLRLHPFASLETL